MSRKEKREKEEQQEKERKKTEKEKRKNKKQEPKIDKDKKNSKGQNKDKTQKKKCGIVKKILKTILKILLIVILIIVLALGCFIGWLGYTSNWDINKMMKKGVKQIALAVTGQTEADLSNLDPIYCLVLGISTDEGLELTDTIMVVAYYPKTQQASILSIPRDTFVGKSEATAGGGDKINALYQYRGIDGILNSVEKLTGLDINNYVIVKNDGVIQVVDAIGGVRFVVPMEMNYDDGKQKLYIHLKEGEQVLNGEQAEGLLRFRKNNDGTSYPASYGDNDIGRMRTQREFIKETARQTIQAKNISKINELIEIGFKNIETNLDMNYVMKYVPAIMDFDVSVMQMESLPGVPATLGPQNLSFFKVDKQKTKQIVQEFFTFNQEMYDSGSEEIGLKPENIKLQLLNASGDEKILEDAEKRLKAKGYHIEETGTTTIAKTTKVINRTEKREDVVDELIDTLGYGNTANGKDKLKYDFTIVLGQDMNQLVVQE